MLSDYICNMTQDADIYGDILIKKLIDSKSLSYYFHCEIKPSSVLFDKEELNLSHEELVDLVLWNTSLSKLYDQKLISIPLIRKLQSYFDQNYAELFEISDPMFSIKSGARLIFNTVAKIIFIGHFLSSVGHDPNADKKLRQISELKLHPILKFISTTEGYAAIKSHLYLDQRINL